MSKGIFSKEIKARIANKQILVNGQPIDNDIDLDVDADSIIDVGDFIFGLLKNGMWALRLRMFGLEALMSGNMNNDLTEFLKNFVLIRISKKEAFIIKRK